MNRTINFMKMRRFFFVVSAAAVLASIISFLGIFGFNKGIDFTGGLTAQLNTHFFELDVARLRALFTRVPVIRTWDKDGRQEQFFVNLGENISRLEVDTAVIPAVKDVTDNSAGFLIRIKNLKGAGWSVSKDQLENSLSTILREKFAIRAKMVFQVVPAEAGADKALLDRQLAKLGNAKLAQFRIDQVDQKTATTGARTLFLVSHDLTDSYTTLGAAYDKLFAGRTDFVMQGKLTASAEQYTVEILGDKTTEAEIALRKVLGNLPVERITKVDGQGDKALYTVHGRVIDEAGLAAGVETLFAGQNAFTLLRNTRTRDKVEFLYTFNWDSFTAVSATIGKEVETTAITLSIGVALAILFYVAIRFDWRFGLAAVAALFHDILIMLGFISVLQIELSVPIIVSILTILGYSINDTIVIFDRIRENLAFTRKEDLPDLIDRSVTQSMARTLLTSLTTLVAVLAIFLFAGPVLRDFSFALLVGIVVGTYSSIYIASPLYVLIEKLSGTKELKKKGTVPV